MLGHQPQHPTPDVSSTLAVPSPGIQRWVWLYCLDDFEHPRGLKLLLEQDHSAALLWIFTLFEITLNASEKKKQNTGFGVFECPAI